MWLDVPKLGIYTLIDEAMRIEAVDGGDYLLVVGEFEIDLNREQRDMFIAIHEEAMDMDANVMHFDQDAPKFTMKLSGRGDLPMDVGLE